MIRGGRVVVSCGLGAMLLLVHGTAGDAARKARHMPRQAHATERELGGATSSSGRLRNARALYRVAGARPPELLAARVLYAPARPWHISTLPPAHARPIGRTPGSGSLQRRERWMVIGGHGRHGAG